MSSPSYLKISNYLFSLQDIHNVILYDIEAPITKKYEVFINYLNVPAIVLTFKNKEEAEMAIDKIYDTLNAPPAMMMFNSTRC